MLSKVFSAAIVGLDAQIIEVEVEVSYGLRCFNIVGLPDKAVEESKERVVCAVKNSGFRSPVQQPFRILVSLAPADLKKEGSIYDLPIAIAYLSAIKSVNFGFSDKVIVGELALDGRVRPIKGALSFALSARDKNYKEIILPKDNIKEAALVKGINVIGVESLKDAILYLERKRDIKPTFLDEKDNNHIFEQQLIDIGFIKGQESAKRALQISAAGGHNVLMVGPPGTGKTLLAKAIVSILPKLTTDESLEVTKIYSVSGLLPSGQYLISIRPFRAPHHTCSEVALIGGGNPPKPGEITLSHKGILFLDEFPEFHRNVLESMRQPLEEGKITIARAKHRVVFPANFTLIAASNPCPCGNLGDPEKRCLCSNSQIRMYKNKLSGPLIDRIDLLINVPKVQYEKLIQEDKEGVSMSIKTSVEKARKVQKDRFRKDMLNSQIDIEDVKKYCQLENTSHSLLRKYVDNGKLSARGYYRVLKVARTIADLDNSENIKYNHIAEALMYRLREE
jgi:magnesium chelatase family protein